ncbi:hypothetical protein, partial [Alistipes putredinis]|uniref:hypothetical protein n=1 Tax=Alistipes putredinis TaxID=28117 RepID=UPI003AB71C00
MSYKYLYSHERYLYRGYLQIAPLDMLDNRNVLRTLLWDPLEPMATHLALMDAEGNVTIKGRSKNMLLGA